jgi:hypothetical protein
VLSKALTKWRGDRCDQVSLAETTAASAARGTPAEVAVADLHLASYVRVCCAEYQAFCVNLYSDAVEALLVPVRAMHVRQELIDVMVSGLTSQTALGRGNPSSGNLSTDFDRLDINVRRNHLARTGPATLDDIDVIDKELLVCRNQLAHGVARLADIQIGTSVRSVTLARATAWFQALDRLASTMDTVVTDDLTAPLGARPW